MKNIIIFLGLPASGKGTQATLLKEKLNYENLSTGYLLRKEVEKKTELGNKIAEIINAGNLVSDELIFEILKNNMKDIETNGFILDGFPRTLKQAEMLSNYLDNNKELKIQKVFLINLDDKVVIERICDRISCNKCGATYNHTSKKPKVEGVCDICGSTELVDRSDDLDAEAVLPLPRTVVPLRANCFLVSQTSPFSHHFAIFIYLPKMAAAFSMPE